MNSETEKTLLQIATEAEVLPEAIQLIYCVFNHLHATVQTAVLDGRLHVTATSLCDGLQSFAQLTYGETYRHVLRTWNLDTSEKLGRAISVLVEHGWVRLAEGDQIVDFNGRFNLSENGG